MKYVLLLVVSLTVLLSGFQPVSPDGELLLREIKSLTDQGLQAKLFNGMVEAVDPISKQRWQFPMHMSIHGKPTRPGLPMLTVDLNVIDTSLYAWKYHYESTIPMGNSSGFPFYVKDVDGNGLAEAYGITQTQGDYGTRVFEWDGSSSWVLRYTFDPFVGLVDGLADIDENGNIEVYCRLADSLFAFEQASRDALPINSKFRFRQWYYGATGIPNQFADIDNSGTQELIFRGSEPDTLHPPYGNIEKTYVAQFDTVAKILFPFWGAQLPPGCQGSGCTSAIAVGDYDSDGQQEFVTSNFAGKIYLVDFTDSDSFRVSWEDSISVAGRAASGDVDGNGLTEFFVGGDELDPDGYVHTRIFAYEQTGNGAYAPSFAFDIFPTGRFFVTLFMTRDMDGDGFPELLLSFAGGVMIFKGSGPHSYTVFYYRPTAALDGIGAAPIDSIGDCRLFVSTFRADRPSYRSTDVFRIDSLLTSIRHTDATGNQQENVLLGNYPNPFNSTTAIRYYLDKKALVRMTVYEITGKIVKVLVNERQEAGLHTVDWHPEDGQVHPSSGVYLYRLILDGQVFHGKMLLIK